VTRGEFDAACRRLPSVHMVVQWGEAEVYKIGPRIFAVLGPDGSFSLKASDIAFEALTASGRGRPAPHLARAKWVRFDDLAAVETAEIEDLLASAHAQVAAKLTRAQRRELGLD
jgi:predicted DNA-binding protein (MmcQ/YjbR family)